jgi:phosphate transport system protein
MKEKFIHLLDDIKKDLVYLANEVENNIRQAIKALKKGDSELARQIVDKDVEIDDMEVKIEKSFLELLALQQPVAIDLRFIVGGLKMNNDLERIGDHAVNIAKTVISCPSMQRLDSVKKVNQMKKISCSMLHDVVSAFIHQDAEEALEMRERDEELDVLYEEVVVLTKDILKKDPDKLDENFAIVRVARSLERVGDLATNIGEEVVFMKEAKIIRHKNVEKE